MNFFKRLLFFTFIPSLALLLSGCFSDPSTFGEIAPWSGGRWTPCPLDDLHDTPIMPCADVVQQEWESHQGPWQAIELVDIALQNNPLTRQSWYTAKAAAFDWRTSESILYPTVELTEEILLQKIHGFTFGNINNINNSISPTLGNNVNLPTPGLRSVSCNGGGSGNAAAAASTAATAANMHTYNQWIISNLSVSYLMFDFGGRLASIESARQALISANWTHNRNMQTIILNVLTDYYLHVQAKALFLARKDDLKDAIENLKAAEGQFQSGIAKITDVLLTKSNLANNELLLEQQNGTVKTSLGQLATSIGMPANAVFEVAEFPNEINLDQLNNNIDELIAIAKETRPDLAASEAIWREAKENTIVAWSSGMPTLTAYGTIQNTKNIHFHSLDGQLYSGAIFIDVPLFNGFFYVNQTRSAMSTASAAFASWKNQEELVILDVVTSYYNFKTAVETVKSSEELYKYSKEAYDAAIASYKNGVGTILDVLAALSSLSNARAQRIQARTQWITALTNVAYATGQL